MNMYWQVVRTYLWRPRFWVLTVAYVFFTFGVLWDASPDGRHQLARPQAVMSGVFACLTGSFLALHVRRQFGSATALVTPGFAAPHLVVAALASAWLWLILPGSLILSGHWPRAALALHAFAGILTALVAIHARAILLIVAVPVILAWSSRFVEGQKRFSTSFMLGEWPALELTIVLVAVVTHVCAFLWLRRLPRQGITASDELVIDASASSTDLNPLSSWLLGTRDEAADRLMNAGWLKSIQRWRVPVAISPIHLAVPVIIVAACGAIGRFFGSTADWLTLAAVTTSAVLLLIPLGPWHFRRKTMSYELLRPITRERYFGEMMAAMAVDVVVWTLLSSGIVFVVYWANMLSFQRPEEQSNFMLGFLMMIWAIAVFVYGLGVATMRLPFWLPVVAGGTLIWSIGVMLACVEIAESFWHGVQRHAHAMQPVLWFAVVSVAAGLVLGGGTYRRWISRDVP